MKKKTLAGFLAIIDNLIQRAIAEKIFGLRTHSLSSPLKALSNDIEKNLQLPLKGIQNELRADHIEIDEIHAMVRTGDSTASERARLVRLKPQIVVTTPESLYLLLTSVSGRDLLSTIETVIIDEIHALVSNRRGAHLALSLERLEALRLERARAGDIQSYAHAAHRYFSDCAPVRKGGKLPGRQRTSRDLHRYKKKAIRSEDARARSRFIGCHERRGLG